MTDDRERWALILGGSSGMGEATAITLAKAGYNICGIHLDFRAALAHVEEVKAAIEAAGAQALYINMNAADDEKRATALAAFEARFAERFFDNPPSIISHNTACSLQIARVRAATSW